MARPQLNTVSYFPFYCEDGSKMFYLEETYGNDGFASFVKILRELAKTENHYLDLSKNTTMMFLSAKCKVPKTTLESIIKDLVELGKFDRVLWEENSIIWCEDFINSIQDAYLKRKSKCITYPDLLLLLVSLGVRKPSKSKNKVPDNTQRKEEEIKEEKNKENNGVVFPFESDIFFKEWNNWKSYRSEIKKPYKGMVSEQAALNSLSKFNEEFSIHLIKKSMANNWQGLIFDKTQQEYEQFRKTGTQAQFGAQVDDIIGSGSRGY